MCTLLHPGYNSILPTRQIIILEPVVCLAFPLTPQQYMACADPRTGSAARRTAGSEPATDGGIDVGAGPLVRHVPAAGGAAAGQPAGARARHGRGEATEMLGAEGRTCSGEGGSSIIDTG